MQDFLGPLQLVVADSFDVELKGGLGQKPTNSLKASFEVIYLVHVYLIQQAAFGVGGKLLRMWSSVYVYLLSNCPIHVYTHMCTHTDIQVSRAQPRSWPTGTRCRERGAKAWSLATPPSAPRQ